MQERSLGANSLSYLMLVKFLVTLQEGGLLFNGHWPDNLYTISRALSVMSG
jgi:hypothetical protein